MTWAQLTPTELGELSSGILWAVRKSRTTIAVRSYAFGQYRIQVWFDNGEVYPEILAPEC